MRPVAPAAADIPALVAAALDCHRRGDLDQAIARYRTVLAVAPDQPDALHLLGVARFQEGEHDAAAELIGRAIARESSKADYHANLGAALQALKRYDEAEASYRRALELNPDQIEALNNLAAVYHALGRSDDAIECCRRAITVDPRALKAHRKRIDLLLGARRYPESMLALEALLAQVPNDAAAHNNIGYAAEQLGRIDEALQHYRRAVAICPEAPEYLSNLAILLRRMGHGDEAKQYFDRAVAADANAWENERHRGAWLANIGQLDAAIALFRRLAEESPDDVEVLTYLGALLCKTGQSKEARGWLVKALEIKPDHAEAMCHLGTAFFGMKEMWQAEAAFRKALELRPGFLDAHINLCEIMESQNRRDEADIMARATLHLDGFLPDVMVFPFKAFRGCCDFDAIEEMGDIWQAANAALDKGNLPVAFLHLLVEADTVEASRRLTALHRAWAERIERKAAEAGAPQPVPQLRSGRIKVGLLSSDLRRHSVAKFVLPLLRAYDRDRLEITAYSLQRAPNDPVQAEIRSLIDRFVDVECETAGEISQLIRGDAIDALVELNGFTAGSRIGALASRMAPIQICWLGYPYTTGFKDIDYILVDRFVAPTVPDLFVEQPLVVPHSWVCFEGFDEVAIDPMPPCERNGYVTFGTLNNPYKFSRSGIAAWSRVLHAVPGSRFLVVRPEGQSRMLAENLIKAFGRHGIGPERLFILSNEPNRHLHCYNSIDIALDTFPLTGGTTTCDALWMGVPTVTLRGPGMHQRLSHALLNHANLGELSSDNLDDYVRTAAALAAEPQALRLLRATLRDTVRNSPLCRAELFADGFRDRLEAVARERGLR